MAIHKFTAPTMSEGLNEIQRTLGADAIILNVNPRASGQSGFEITVEAPEPAPKLSGPSVVMHTSVAPTTASPVQPPTSEAIPNGFHDTLQALVQQLASLQKEVRQLRLQQELHQENNEGRPRLPVALPSRTHASPDHGRLRNALRISVSELLQSPEQNGRDLSLSYQALCQNGVLEHHVEELVSQAFSARQTAAWPGEHFHDYLEDTITWQLETGPALWQQEGRQMAVFLGPTGIGKTTSIAKIAAHAKLIHKRSVGVICADTARLGGVYQLQAYAKLIDLPMRVASSMAEMQDALDALQDFDLILIDTTGYSPLSAVPLQTIPFEHYLELNTDRELLYTLCLSATTRTQDTIEICQAFSNLPLSSLLFTKLDEAQGIGVLLSAAMASRLPISHVCFGPQVPDHIDVPTPRQLARWIRTTHPYGIVRPTESNRAGS